MFFFFPLLILLLTLLGLQHQLVKRTLTRRPLGHIGRFEIMVTWILLELFTKTIPLQCECVCEVHFGWMVELWLSLSLSLWKLSSQALALSIIFKSLSFQHSSHQLPDSLESSLKFELIVHNLLSINGLLLKANKYNCVRQGEAKYLFYTITQSIAGKGVE